MAHDNTSTIMTYVGGIVIKDSLYIIAITKKCVIPLLH